MTVFCGFGGFAVVVVVNQIPMEAAPVRNGITIKSRKEKKGKQLKTKNRLRLRTICIIFSFIFKMPGLIHY
jgi:hypothetical protein